MIEQTVDIATKDGATTMASDNGCGWVKVFSNTLERRSTANDLGFSDVGNGLATGVQYRISGPWQAGFSLGWDNHSIQQKEVAASSSGDLFTGAAVVKWEDGAGSLAVALAGGSGRFSSQRTFGLATPEYAAAFAKSTFGLSFVQADARASWLFTRGAGYAKPQIAVSVNDAMIGQFSEVGAGAIGSRSPGGDHLGVTIKPAVEMGFDIKTSAGTALRPWLVVGAVIRPDPTFTLPVAFDGSTVASGTYDQSTRMDRAAATVDAGFDLIRDRAYNISVGYKGELGSQYVRQGAQVKVTIPF